MYVNRQHASFVWNSFQDGQESQILVDTYFIKFVAIWSLQTLIKMLY